MEILQYEERQFRFKLMNVFLQYIKTALQLTVFGYQGAQLFDQYEQDVCTLGQKTFINITYNGSIALVIFNTVSAVYILCQKHFVRIEFFITYGLNLIWFFSIMAFALKELLIEQNQCISIQLIVKSVLYLSIINQFDVILIMILNHETANRQVNICSNTVVIILILTSNIPTQCATNTESMEFMMIAANMLPIIFFTGLNISLAIFTKMKEQLYNTFRFSFVLVFSFLLINYLLVIYYLVQGKIHESIECMPLQYVTQSYVWIVPITLSGMVSILYSLNLQKMVFQGEDEDNEDVPKQQIIFAPPPPPQRSFEQSNINLQTPNRLSYNNYNHPTFQNQSGIIGQGNLSTAQKKLFDDKYDNHGY